MFRRKEEGTDSEGAATTTQTTSGNANNETAQAASSQQPAYQAGRSSQDTVATSATRPTPVYRPSPVAEFTRASSRQTSTPHTAGNTNERAAGKTASRILTVGNDILLRGEIATCDRLVIEGRVEAKLSEVHTVEISASGSFKGNAEVEDAEVSGIFEGDLVVKNRLVIYSTGEVRGNISYGEIEIERGGRLTGQIKTVGGNSSSEKPTLLEVLEKKHHRTAKEAAEA